MKRLILASALVMGVLALLVALAGCKSTGHDSSSAHQGCSMNDGKSDADKCSECSKESEEKKPDCSCCPSK